MGAAFHPARGRRRPASRAWRRWSVDETHVKVGGAWPYVLRLRPRDIAAARRSFTVALVADRAPEEVVTDQHVDHLGRPGRPPGIARAIWPTSRADRHALTLRHHQRNSAVWAEVP